MNRQPGALTLSEDDDATAVADEVRWQQCHASSTVRDVLARLPPRAAPRGMLGVPISEVAREARERQMTPAWRYNVRG